MTRRFTITHKGNRISSIDELEGYWLDSINAWIPLWRRVLVRMGFKSFLRYRVETVYRKKDGPGDGKNAKR